MTHYILLKDKPLFPVSASYVLQYNRAGQVLLEDSFTVASDLNSRNASVKDVGALPEDFEVGCYAFKEGKFEKDKDYRKEFAKN